MDVGSVVRCAKSTKGEDLGNEGGDHVRFDGDTESLWR